MKIKNLEIKTPTILAPMEGVNSETFIRLCAEKGAGIVTTQAIETIDELKFYNLKKLSQEIHKTDSKLMFQIMTNEIETAKEIIKKIEPYVDIIDFNFGCPLKKILGEKKGGYLLQFPHLIKKLLEPIIRETDKPITIKIRLGFDEKRETFLEIGKIAEEIGISAITIHARYVKDGYQGKANWEKIKELKKHLSIPIIANGDIFKAGQAKMLIDKKYCDGIMLGREAKNNPHIFTEIKELFENTPKEKRQINDLKKTIKKFYERYLEQERKNLHQLQDHICWLVSGEKKAKELKKIIRETKTYDEIKKIIENKI
jgi:nifR3 family TIM-barrel protein